MCQSAFSVWGIAFSDWASLGKQCKYKGTLATRTHLVHLHGCESMKKGERTCKIGRHGDDHVSLLQVGTATDSMEPPEARYRMSFGL